jgi:uncharacterized protein YecE (DUF72 family)
MIYVGTSGYSYKYWSTQISQDGNELKSFYPAKCKTSEKQFDHYSSLFSSVEINCTRFKALTVLQCENWAKNSPKHFKFVIKVDQYITNFKKMNDFKDIWKGFWDALQPLIKANKLGCVLFLFNDKFACTEKSLKLLAEAKKEIHPELLCAFEFRDKKWYEHNHQSIFQGNWCIVTTHCALLTQSLGNLESNVAYKPKCDGESKSNFQYIRLHGRLNFCEGTYGQEYLQQFFAQHLRKNIASTFIFFNNTDTWEPVTMDPTQTIPLNAFYPISRYASGKMIMNMSTIPSAILDATTTKMLLENNDNL